MIRSIFTYGVVAGLVVAIPMVWIMLSVPPGEMPEHGVVTGYLTMIVALTAVFLGVKHYRDRVLGGVIRFGTAFLLGLAISAVASVIYAIGWEICLAYGNFDFADFYATMTVDAAKAKGVSGEELQKVVTEAESFVKMYRNPFYRFPLTFIEMFPVGILISLISAALLRNPRVLPARAAA